MGQERLRVSLAEDHVQLTLCHILRAAHLGLEEIFAYFSGQREHLRQILTVICRENGFVLGQLPLRIQLRETSGQLQDLRRFPVEIDLVVQTGDGAVLNGDCNVVPIPLSQFFQSFPCLLLRSRELELNHLRLLTTPGEG